MVVTPKNPVGDGQLSALWHAACTDYANETGKSLVQGELPQLRGPEDLSRHLEKEQDHFQDFRMKRRPLLHAMQTVIAPFETWGGLIAVSSFPPASTIMGAMLLLVQGVRKVSEAFDMITAMFRKLGHFALRLDSYRGVPLSEGMKVIIVKVLVNFLRVCAASQKLVSRGSFKARLTQWAKSTFLEDSEVGGLLGELEELTSQEHMMVSAHGLKLTNQALKNTEELLERDNRRNDRERLQRVKAALNPVPGSSQVFSSINESRIPGSGAWVEERLRSWWEGSEPILWLHGGPGVGKSFLASKIITELSSGEWSAAPAPVVASFFCRNNDVDLRSLNKALRTLAWQVVSQREDFAAHADDFCLQEDVDNSYVVWRKLLLQYLVQVPAQGTCLVIDGIDEAEPEEQEILCSLLERSFSEEDMSRPPLRVVMLSRDSLRGLLDEHSLAWIDEVEVGNDQNKDDLHGYVAAKLQKTKLFRGSPEFQQEIVEAISREAEGMWEWANLVIKSVLRCRTKEQIRRGIKTMPRGISAMLTQELQRLGRELSATDDMSDGEESEGERATQISQLNVILSFVALAQKPLTVSQLELILEIIFKEEVLNLEEDLRTLYSSLLLLRPKTKDDDDGYDDDVNLVVLRHSSFYEFFRSPEHSGPVGVNVDQAQVNFLYVLFYALRGKRTPTTDRSTRTFWEYAQSFLPTHLKEASPSKSGKWYGKISALVEDLFTKEECRAWLVEEILQRNFTQYCFYAASYMTSVSSFWLGGMDREIINQRAEMVMQWLLPETKQAFENHAQASAIASNVCPFTVLFSYMADYWLRLWLEPQDIATNDGLPDVLPNLLAFYNDMVDEYSKEADSRETEITAPMQQCNDAAKIMAIVEPLRHERTPLWYARVAQALLLNGHYAAAREHFRTALDEHERTPTLDPASLSGVHRDLSRACAEIGRHAEALEHYEMSEQLFPDNEKPEEDSDDRIFRDLNAARLKQRAKRTEDAIATANEAWDRAFKDNYWWGGKFGSFFKIFLELHQPQRLRPVFDRAAQFCDVEDTNHFQYKDFADFLFEELSQSQRMIYQVLQYVLTPDDGDHLDRVVSIMKQLDSLDSRQEDIPMYKYLVANVLFTKGRVDAGLDGWCQVLGTSDGNGCRSDIKYPHARAIGQLVTVCLENPEITPCERCPLALSSADQVDEACLIISAWLRKHGDVDSAREVLRGRVKHCIELLSDDDVSNDVDAFKTLFRTFVADPDSAEDREAALYLIKQSHEACLVGYNNIIQSRSGRAAEDQEEGCEDDHVDPEELNTWVLNDDLSECSNCRTNTHIHSWYFCCSCPQTTLCRRCYRELRSGSPPSGSLGPCLSEHELYYTGGFLRPSEMVDDGKVPLVSAEGERQVIWVEEWKDRLAEKWKTTDFEFEGGLSTWCMRVLPEPQRTRWAAFFQT